jgi:stringent starvation protein B
MTDIKQHVISEHRNWIIDNGRTPYILINTQGLSVISPLKKFAADDNRIVLNLSNSAIRDLYISDAQMAFNTVFAGHPYRITVLLARIIAVYAKETGEGIRLGDSIIESTPPAPKLPVHKKAKLKRRRPSYLKVIK